MRSSTVRGPGIKKPEGKWDPRGRKKKEMKKEMKKARKKYEEEEVGPAGPVYVVRLSLLRDLRNGRASDNL